MNYEVTDEGLECTISIGKYDMVTVIFSDVLELDEICKVWISEITENWHKSTKNIEEQISKYLNKVYSQDSKDYELEHIYIYTEDDIGTFGLMFRLGIDIEHGLGVKYENFEIKKVGSADIAFC